MFKVEIVGYEVITPWATIDVCVMDKAFYLFFLFSNTSSNYESENSSLRTAKNTFKNV